MKTYSRRTTIQLASAALATAGAAVPALAQGRYNWTLATGHARNFAWIVALQDVFVPELKARMEAAGHTLNLTEAYAGTLLRIGNEIESMDRGLADFSVVGALFHQARLPLQLVNFFAPFSVTDVENAIGAVGDVYDEVPEFGQAWEDANLVHLAGIGSESLQIFTKTPISSLAELQGVKVGAAGVQLNWLRGTGAIPVSLTPATIYNDLQTGIYDAIMTATSNSVGLRLNEVTPYMLRTNFNATYWAGLAVSKRTFDSLPVDVQQIVREAAAVYEASLIEMQQRGDQEAVELLQAAEPALEVTEMTNDARQEWADSLPDIATEWADELEQQGLPARRVMSVYMDGVRSRGETPMRDWDAFGA